MISIEETESRSTAVKMMIRILPRCFWIHGQDPNRIVISLGEDFEERTIDIDIKRGKKVRKLGSNIIPVEGGILINNLHKRRSLLAVGIVLSILWHTGLYTEDIKTY